MRAATTLRPASFRARPPPPGTRPASSLWRSRSVARLNDTGAATAADAGGAAAALVDAELGRRAMFGATAAAGLAVLNMRAQPATAAYGEAARIFSPSQEKLGTDYLDYSGEGYTISIPQRGFNPTRKGGLLQFPGVDVMWEDMMSTDVATVSVSVFDKSGLPDLKDLQFLFGKDVWDCETSNQCNDTFLREQGFTTGSSVGHIMKEEKAKDAEGNDYAVYDVLTRYQDGSQGGRWHLIKAGSKGGKQYVAQFVGGEKHWAHNKPIAEAVRDSFTLAGASGSPAAA